jgi:pilus assembly protein CpaE
MLTAAVLSADPISSEYLMKLLNQTEYIHTVIRWIPNELNAQPRPDPIPDVVLLDLYDDVETMFSHAATIHRARPATHIIACSHPATSDSNIMLRAMRSGVKDFLQKPVEISELREVLSRIVREMEAAGAHSQDRTTVVMGAKGGVGTTTIATNLAVQLVHLTKKSTILIDLARPLGHVPVLLDLQPRFSIREAAANLNRLDASFVNGLLCPHKSGVQILAGASHSEEWRAVTGEVIQRVVNLAKSSFENVVLDVGTDGTDDLAPLLRGARSVLVVTESSVPSLWSLERQVSSLHNIGVNKDRVRTLVNRWRREDETAIKNIERATNWPAFLRLPNDFRHVNEALNLGVPLASNNGASALVGKLQEIARQLGGIKAGPEQKSGLRNLLSLG